MNAWVYGLPLLSALLGWVFVSILIKRLFHPVLPRKFIGITFQGLVPKQQPSFARQAGIFSAEMLSVKEIEEKITHPDNVKKIMPQAEEHIDHFLRVKLVKSMPVVGMFVGDKTINSLKALFVDELEQLFPEIMKTYMGRLQDDFNIEQMVTAKIASYPPADIEKSFLQLFKKELRTIKGLGALMGLLIGLLQLLIQVMLLH